mgnify:FL=1
MQESSFDLYNKICSEVSNECERLLYLVEEFSKIRMRELLKIPYYVNIIDELHINENAHSRILLKFLEFRNQKGEYEILQSLIDYISSQCRKDSFKNIHIQEPEITHETERIDLWIKDKDYAIIFENKACWAVDQDAQISRYIDKTKNKGYNEEQIYIIYLPPESKEPEPQSWGLYKDAFENRYINLSFKEYVLPWLKSDVIPNVKQKDIYLYTALIQYVDYLEGIFLLRNNQKNMNMELEKFLIEHLKIDEKCGELGKEKVLDENIKNFEDILTQMKSLKDKIRRDFFEKYRNQVKSDYPSLRPCEHQKYLLDVTIDNEGEGIIIGIGEYDGRFFCLTEYESNKTIENTLLLRFMDEQLLDKRSPNQIWRYFTNNLDDFDNVYKLFKSVVDKINTEYIPQEKQIQNLFKEMKKGEGECHVYNGYDLVISFNKDTKTNIGIESEYKATQDNPTGIFKIYITTWHGPNLNLTSQDRFNYYRKDILEKYPETDGYFLDEKASNNGRVYYHMPAIDGENRDEIISKLNEYYEFIKQLADNKKNL